MRETYKEYFYNDPFMKTFMMPAVMPNDYDNRHSNNNNKMMNQSKFINEEEGFLRGNMEINTYVPYKNMNYIRPNLTNERQKDLYRLQEVSFAAHDANLYLDTHPEDTNMIRLYNQYLEEEKRLTDMYERKYGPLDLTDNDGLEVTPWAWIKEPWPWNK